MNYGVYTIFSSGLGVVLDKKAGKKQGLTTEWSDERTGGIINYTWLTLAI